MTRPTYCTRRQVKAATDIHTTADFDLQVDSAMDSAADEVDALCHRRFYNVLTTQFWNWPNFQRAYPWRIWFDERELATATDPEPTVTTGGQQIPNSAIFYEPNRYAPPFTHLELDRSQSFAFGVGSTPQRDVSILGLFGFWTKTAPAGTLAAAVTDQTSTLVQVSDSSKVDVGDVAHVGTESMLVTDTTLVDTGLMQSGNGATTASDADNQLDVGDGTQVHPQEILTLDGEAMLVTSVAGNVATVIRAWDGTVLATHAAAAIYAPRGLVVTRGDFGSTAATHAQGDAVTVAVVPGLVRELALAEALNGVYQKTSAYARTIGEGERVVPGGSLPDLRCRVVQAFGRKARTAVI